MNFKKFLAAQVMAGNEIPKIFHLVIFLFELRALAFLQIKLDFQTPNYANGCKDYPSIFGADFLEAFCNAMTYWQSFFGTKSGKT